MMNKSLAASVVAVAITTAGCGNPPQSGQPALQALSTSGIRTPQPGSEPSRYQERPSLPLNLRNHHGVLYLGDSDSIGVFALTKPNPTKIGSISGLADSVWGMRVDSNGTLYAATGGAVSVYPYGSSTPSMTYDHGIHRVLYAVADSAGHVFASGFRNSGSGRVVEYNVGSNAPIAHANVGNEADGIDVDAQGNLYVAYRTGYTEGSIAKFGPGLTHRRNLGMSINQPQGLLIDRSGNIVVVQSALQNIEVFPPKSKTPSLTVPIDGSSSYHYAHTAELAMRKAEGRLWVSDEAGDVYVMLYPLTQSTVPVLYEAANVFSNGIAVSDRR